MKYSVVSRSDGARRLILFFAGWGMDAAPFAALSRRGYDVAVVWDYRTTDIDLSFAGRYDEICVVAWSMGVFAASVATASLGSAVTRRVAVNGTLSPVSDSEGIPAAIYYGTRDRLDARNLEKFYRRMFADRACRDAFMLCVPRRDIDGLRDELTAIASLAAAGAGGGVAWDRAYVSSRDAIFPPGAQRQSWERRGVPVVETDGGHWVGFQEIIDREFIDKDTMAERFATRRDTYEEHGPVQAEVVDALCDAARRTCGDDLADTQGTVLEVGCGSGLLSRRLAAMAPRASLVLWDIAGECPAGVSGHGRCRFERVDAEVAVAGLAPGSVDFIFSASTVQWFNSPARFFSHCAAALRPGGVMAVSTFTRGNLEEISAVTGRALQLPDRRGWLDMAGRWFEIEHECAMERRLGFDSPLAALRHLQLTGVNSLGGSARDVVRRMRPAADGRFYLTYRPMIMILRKK